MVNIKLLEDTELSKKGEIVNYAKKSADFAVSIGIAEYVKKDTKEKKVKISKVKKEDKRKAKQKQEKTITPTDSLPKQILDKYVVKVIKKDAIFSNSDDSWGVDQTKAVDYTGDNYSDDMVLMYTPIDWLRLEFEDTPDKNRQIINIIEVQVKSLGYDYCITEHQGAKSPYFNICGLPHPESADDWRAYKNLIIDQLLPTKFLGTLDRTNLGITLSPIIGHQHWKPKYNGAKHLIVRGKNPIEQENKKNEILLDILKKLNKAKKSIKKEIVKIKGNSRWVEDFLLDYCLKNKLPQGNRHNIICKNLAIMIAFRSDRELIIKQFIDTQKMKESELFGWLNGATNGSYTSISVGEIKKYIMENDIPYKIKEYGNDYDVTEDMKETLQEMCNPYMNVEALYKKIPFFYDVNGLYWFWNKINKNWELKDDVDIINLIGKTFKNIQRLTTSQLINEYLKCIQLIGRQNIPKEPKKTWVQFKDKIFDITSGKSFESTPEYFFTNPLPYSPAETSDCKMIDKLFDDWNPKQKQLMYEIIAYCCLMDYPLHFIFMLSGIGSNGKSKYQKLLRRFINEQKNCCSVDLDILVDNRFESAKLYRKLICLMGETNFGVMNKTNRLKALTGQDLVGIEFKNKQPFDTVNYAKIIIASNSLPTTDDTTDGFFRRWLIIDFPNRFPEQECPIDKLPDSEFEKLAKKCIEILPDLLKKSRFTNQGTIEERKKKYIMVSNPISEFLKNVCVTDVNRFVRYSELYTAYIYFLDKHKKRVISKKAFSDSLDREAIMVEKTSKQIDGEWSSDRWVVGLCLKPDWKQFCDSNDTCAVNLTQLSIRELSGNHCTSVPSVTKTKDFINNNQTNIQENILDVKEEKVGEIPTNYNKYDKCYISCSICGKTDENYLANDNKSYCKDCLKAKEVNSN